MENVDKHDLNFNQMNVDKWLLNNINYLNYSKPTDIQKLVIPKLIKDENINLIGIAKTGTGKTASFCIPILNRLAMDPCGIFALILEPTRELAMQVMEKLKVYSAGFNLRLQMIIGGVDITDQMLKMETIPHIIVATPGRLAYMLEYSPEQFKFINNLKFLVLDEFDQLFNTSILPEIKTILKYLPSERNTLFFSATLDNKINEKEFISQFYNGKSPLVIDCSNIENKIKDENNINTKSKLVDGLIQKYVLIPRITKEHYLIYLLQNDFRKKFMIIFVSSCKQCHYISHLLELFNVKVSYLHSKLPQKKRFLSLEKFKARLNSVLVATDIASRGLDIPSVDLVINYDIPRNPDDYIHRVGRTARAGACGEAVSFVSQYDVDLILAIEEVVGNKMEEMTVSEDGVMSSLGLITKGIKIVQMKIFESGFEEKIDKRKAKDKKLKNDNLENI